MPSSPATPSRRRRSSGFSINLTRTFSQTSTGSNPQRTHSRKSSLQSIGSPRTPRPGSALERSQDLGLIGEVGIGAGTANGLGSLADELAEEEWDEDEITEQEYVAEGLEQTSAERMGSGPQFSHEQGTNSAMLSPTVHSRDGNGGIAKKNRPRHDDYDGSEYGDSDDLEEVQGISESLELKMAAVESLARQGTGDIKGSDVFAKVTEHLRDLSSQTNVETHITRLSNTNAALSGQLAYQSRLISTLIQPLTSPLAPPPSDEIITEIPPMISTLLLSLPQPALSALTSIHLLRDTSTELITALSHLTDTLQMSRQTTNDASRRLRAATETVGKLKNELNEADEGRVWLERGNWEEQLKKRKAAEVCRDVMVGFEAVCEGWRARIEQGDSNRSIKVGAG